MDDVSPIMTHDAGAGPKQNRTDTMSPREACAREDAFDSLKEAAIPRQTSKRVLKAEPQT